MAASIAGIQLNATTVLIVIAAIVFFLWVKKDSKTSKAGAKATTMTKLNSPRRGYPLLDLPEAGGDCAMLKRDPEDNMTNLWLYTLRDPTGKVFTKYIYADMLEPVSNAQASCDEAPARWRLRTKKLSEKKRTKFEHLQKVNQAELNALRSEKYNHISNSTKRFDEYLDRVLKIDQGSTRGQGGQQSYNR